MKKLLYKTNRYVVLLSLGILLIGSVGIYFSVIYMIDNDITERFSSEKQQVENQLKKGKKISTNEINVGDKIHIDSLNTSQILKPFMRDTSFFDLDEQEEIPFRQLIFPAYIHNKKYTLTISKSLVESDDVIEAISEIIGSVALILLIALLLLNRWISKKIWTPFYHTLNELNLFDVNAFEKINFGETDIFEFNELNNAVKKMTDKMFSDYINLKEFTENASHEIQTPLAIISAKLEMLAQSENLSSEQSNQIQGAYEATMRLSKLNQGLILLTRIENRQYQGIEKVFLKKIIQDRLHILKDFIEKRNLQIILQAENEITLTMNPELATILINNIIGNAIKHNIDGGKIVIELSEKKLCVCNSGNELNIDPEKIFERFKKGKNSDSMGLGLAIAKKIAELYRSKISYNYSNSMHCITILFVA